MSDFERIFTALDQLEPPTRRERRAVKRVIRQQYGLQLPIVTHAQEAWHGLCGISQKLAALALKPLTSALERSIERNEREIREWHMDNLFADASVLIEAFALLEAERNRDFSLWEEEMRNEGPPTAYEN